MREQSSERFALPKIDRRLGWALGCLLMVGGFWFLLSTGRGAILGYLVILACPLMHLLMMRGMGHGGHGPGHSGHGSDQREGIHTGQDGHAGCCGGGLTKGTNTSPAPEEQNPRIPAGAAGQGDLR